MLYRLAQFLSAIAALIAAFAIIWFVNPLIHPSGIPVLDAAIVVIKATLAIAAGFSGWGAILSLCYQYKSFREHQNNLVGADKRKKSTDATMNRIANEFRNEFEAILEGLGRDGLVVADNSMKKEGRREVMLGERRTSLDRGSEGYHQVTVKPFILIIIWPTYFDLYLEGSSDGVYLRRYLKRSPKDVKDLKSICRSHAEQVNL